MSVNSRDGDGQRPVPWEEQETVAAGREAAGIGGRAGDEDLDPAQRPLIESGQGVAEGFELAEEGLIEAAQHGNSQADPLADAFAPEGDSGRQIGEYGEADHEESSGLHESDH
jgi:hypothetical protein